MSTIGLLPTGMAVDTTTGIVTVAANTTAGNYSLTYKICEVNNVANCDSVSSTIVVSAPIIDAVVDTTAAINGLIGGTTTALTLNDSLNGVPVVIGTDPGNVTMSTMGLLPTGMTVDTITGIVTVAANTAAGNYSLAYKICEIDNPTNCDSVSSTIVVEAYVTEPSHADPGIGILMVPASLRKDSTGNLLVMVGNYGQDTIVPNSLRLTLNVGSNAEITGTGVLESWSMESQTSGLGNTIVLTNTVAGFGSFDVENISINVIASVSGLELIFGKIEYTGGASNFAQGNATVENDSSQTSLTGFGIVAQNDIAGPVNGLTALVVVPNVLANDSLNGAPVSLNDVVLVQTGGVNPYLILGPSGEVTLNGNTPAGTYTLTYQICEVTNPVNCDTANVEVEVFREAPDFTPTIDVGTLSISYAGGPKNVIVNINGIKDEASYGSVVVKILKGIAYDFSFAPAATVLTLDGNNGATAVSNIAWELTDENPFFITMTLKPGNLIAGNDFSNFGFTITLKDDVPNQTTQPITVTIVNGTGLDDQNNNNAYTVVIMTIIAPAT
jgi:hypothetical protein